MWLLSAPAHWPHRGQVSYIMDNLVPRPHPQKEEKGLGASAHILGCAPSAVLFSGKPIRFQLLIADRATMATRPCMRAHMLYAICMHRGSHMI